MAITKIKNIPRKLSVLVVTGVPAIVGGGVAYTLSNGSYAAVARWEVILVAGMAVVAWKTGNTGEHHH